MSGLEAAGTSKLYRTLACCMMRPIDASSLTSPTRIGVSLHRGLILIISCLTSISLAALRPAIAHLTLPCVRSKAGGDVVIRMGQGKCVIQKGTSEICVVRWSHESITRLDVTCKRQTLGSHPEAVSKKFSLRPVLCVYLIVRCKVLTHQASSETCDRGKNSSLY